MKREKKSGSLWEDLLILLSSITTVFISATEGQRVEKFAEFYFILFYSFQLPYVVHFGHFAFFSVQVSLTFFLFPVIANLFLSVSFHGFGE